MKRLLAYNIALLLVSVLFIANSPDCSAQQKLRSYVIGFYNLENLFDTYHDDGKNDFEYLPDGANQWTEVKYKKKLENMAKVIRAMKEDNKVYHAVLGVSEIENRHVLEDLVNDPQIEDAGFQIVHFDGPDFRGVDVALLYRPNAFELLDAESIPFDFNSDKIEFSLDSAGKAAFRTRDILMARGLLGGEMFAFFVAHLPSRIGGKGGDLRSRGAEIIYKRSAELREECPGIKIVVMGDMNDNPTDESMTVYLKGKEDIEDVKEDEFFSPFISMLKAGYGSLAYQGAWNIYDLILVNYNLAKAKKGTLKIVPIVKKRFYGRIFHKPFMATEEGQYKDVPLRTFSNGAFIGGYSDHYPTYIVVTNKY